jgi:hypothetical protein
MDFGLVPSRGGMALPADTVQLNGIHLNGARSKFLPDAKIGE